MKGQPKIYLISAEIPSSVQSTRRIKFEVKSKSRGNRFSRGMVNGEIHVFGIVRVLERIAGLVVQKIGECRTPR